MRCLSKLSALAVAPLALVASSAHAALPAGVDTAITAAQTDGLTAVGLLAVLGAAVFIIYKILKRLGTPAARVFCGPLPWVFMLKATAMRRP
jgi:Inovirus Coat protein B